MARITKQEVGELRKAIYIYNKYVRLRNILTHQIYRKMLKKRRRAKSSRGKISESFYFNAQMAASREAADIIKRKFGVDWREAYHKIEDAVCTKTNRSAKLYLMAVNGWAEKKFKELTRRA